MSADGAPRAPRCKHTLNAPNKKINGMHLIAARACLDCAGGCFYSPALSGPPGPATVGIPYSFTPTLAPGATPPVTFSIPVGTLAPGLALNPSTGAITGTPTTLGSYPLTIRATNADGTGDLPITLVALPMAVAVPTLGQWALMVMGLLAAGLGARRLRRQA